MKKLIALLLCLVMVLSLVACGAKPEEGSVTGEPAATDGESETPAAEGKEPSSEEETPAEEPSEEVMFENYPQIKAPVPGRVDTVDVIATIEAEEAANDYPQYDYVVGLHSYDPGYENSATIANGVREELEKYGITVIESYCNMDVSKYPANYDNFFLQEVDLILDAGWLGSESIIDHAMEAGVPVVSYDVCFDAERSWTIGGDPVVAGTCIGEYMAEVIKDEWDGEVDCMIICWSAALGESMENRMQSAVDAMAAAGIDLPEDKIFWYDAGGETLKSKNFMADFLTAHPEDTKILCAANTGNSAQGMLAAIQTAGREDDCMIYSYGAEQVAIDNMKGEPNCWVADVGYFFRQYGWLGANTAIRVLEGEELGYWISPENFVINHDNVDEYQG